MREKETPHTDAEFWAVSDLFRDQEREWRPINAGYELQRTMKVEKSTWTVCLKVHVVPHGALRGRSRHRLRFKSSVTIWPPKLSSEQERRLARLGWYRAIERAIGVRGYRGTWMSCPSGKFGDFWKDLSGVADVRREATWLGRLSLLSAASVLQADRETRADQGTQGAAATRKLRRRQG
jgi:hypothetical protein